MKKFFLIITVCFYSLVLVAQHHEEDHHGHVADKHHHKKHHIVVFDGATTNFSHHSTGYSLGIDYEYHLNDWIGVGAIGEYIFDNDGEFVAGLPVFFHPVKGLKLIVAPLGINAAAHTSDDTQKSGTSISASEPAEKSWHFGARLGAGYDFHINNFSIGPTVAYDITNTQAMIYGISLGIGF